MVPEGQRGSVNVLVTPSKTTTVLCANADLNEAATSRRVDGVSCILTIGLGNDAEIV